MLTDFFGYVFLRSHSNYQLPFSHCLYTNRHCPMSFWGFSVNNATLNRFFSLNYLFLFILVGLILIHLVLLHISVSNSAIGLNANTEKVPFHIYFITKGFDDFVVLGMLLSVLIFYNPYLLGDPEIFYQRQPARYSSSCYARVIHSICLCNAKSSTQQTRRFYFFSLEYSDFSFSSFFHISKLKSLTFRPLGKFFY